MKPREWEIRLDVLIVNNLSENQKVHIRTGGNEIEFVPVIEKSAYEELVEALRFYANALNSGSMEGSSAGEPNPDPYLMPRPLGTLAMETLTCHTRNDL